MPNKRYEDVEMGVQAMNIRTESSPITIYIQHPIPIPAPGDKNNVGMKPLKLTKKEQKKMRKQRRQAELQDKRDRIRMGLIPPDAPKGTFVVVVVWGFVLGHCADDVGWFVDSPLGELDEGLDVGRGAGSDARGGACEEGGGYAEACA